MNYSDEFKRKVLAICGNSESMKTYLDAGNPIVGKVLKDIMEISMSDRDEIDQLYKEWAEMCAEKRPDFLEKVDASFTGRSK